MTSGSVVGAGFCGHHIISSLAAVSLFELRQFLEGDVDPETAHNDKSQYWYHDLNLSFPSLSVLHSEGPSFVLGSNWRDVIFCLLVWRG